jgi:hypothetical protein
MNILEKIDIRFDPTEAFNYYQELENNYQRYKWTYGDFSPSVPENSNYEIMFGWSLNTNNNVDNQPNWDGNGNVFRNTPCAFGFGKKILDFFPNAEYICVTVHPPGTYLGLHEDDEKYKRLHLPLTVSDKFYFIDKDYKEFYMSPGNVHILHTELTHGAVHNGDMSRAHLLVKYPTKLIHEVYEKSGAIIQ